MLFYCRKKRLILWSGGVKINFYESKAGKWWIHEIDDILISNQIINDYSERD